MAHAGYSDRGLTRHCQEGQVEHRAAKKINEGTLQGFFVLM
jgi:hypothetical protein